MLMKLTVGKVKDFLSSSQPSLAHSTLSIRNFLDTLVEKPCSYYLLRRKNLFSKFNIILIGLNWNDFLDGGELH